MTVQLTLQPESTAAGIARRWVRDELRDRQRDDLLESAVLGVSELVTNALLHVRSTINVRIVDREHRLRIEVYDNSSRPPDGRVGASGSTRTPATIGRGLQIVESISLSWGVAYEDVGKVVWFHPMPEGSHRHNRRAASSLPGAESGTATGSAPDGAETVRCELVDVPVVVLAHTRLRFQDLRRELTLIALQARDPDAGRVTVGGRLNDVALKLERYRGTGSNAERTIDAAVAAGLDRVTLQLDLPVSAVPGIIELVELIHEADEFCRSEALLTLASGPQESALRDWYLGDLVAQARGAEPTPWPGEFVVTDPEPSA